MDKARIAEKLVPYVEGVLADEDARGVAEYLSAHPEILEEVKSLKEAIVALRTAAGQGISPPVPGEMSPEELVQLVTDPESLDPVKHRALKALLAESEVHAREAELLSLLDRDLGHKIDNLSAPDSVPVTLRREFERLYGSSRPRSSVAKIGWLESLYGLLASLNPRPFVVMATVLVLLCLGGLFLQRHQAPGVVADLEPTPAGKDLNERDVSERPGAFGGLENMSLASDATDPSELRRQSQVLLDNKVQYAVKDGRLFVAQEDVQRARKVLAERDPRELAQAETRELKPTAPAEALSAIEDQDMKVDAPEDRVSVVRPAPPALPLVEEEKAALEAPPAPSVTAGAAGAEALPESPRVRPAPPPPAPKKLDREVSALKPASSPSEVDSGEPADLAAGGRQQFSAGEQPKKEVTSPSEVDGREGAGAEASDERDKPPAQATPLPSLTAEAKSGVVANVPVGQAAPSPSAPLRRAAAGSATRATSVPNAGAEIPVKRARTGVKESEARSESQLARWAQQVVGDFAEGSVVTTEIREDGSLALYVRAGRELNDEELETLRRLLRDRLALRDTDTIIIRQP